MLTLPIDHPDIEDFIDVKNDLSKVNFANISIMITDDFMNAVENNLDWELKFEVKDTGEIISRTVKAKELFRKIAESNWRMAEPGSLFWSRVQSYHLNSEVEGFSYSATNPCVVGDTKILTDKGNIKIKNIINQEVNVWNGDEFSKVTPRITGENKDILDITLSNGMEVSCTHNHKFIMKDGVKKQASELIIGDELTKWEYPTIESPSGISIPRKEMYTKGFFSGDGCYQNKNRIRSTISIYTKKLNLIKYIDYYNSFTGEKTTLELDTKKYNDKLFVPLSNYTIENRLDWLAGIIDSDGSLNDVGGSITISSINKDFLANIQELLSTLGSHSTINIMKYAGVASLPDGKGGMKEYNRKDCYRLVISAYNVKKLIDLGLLTHRVPLIANPNRGASRFIYVTKIEPREKKEKYVYCFTEPKNHTGIFNGILTGNCGELPLSEGGSCLLSSLNLSEYVKSPFTENAKFNYEKMDKDIPRIVRFMDDLLEEGLPYLPLEHQRESAENYRQIGIGSMGLADMLIKLGLTYGEEESNILVENIMQFFANKALQSSALLAKERGTYPKYSMGVLNSTYLQAVATDETKELIRKHGLRNSQILTIAPNGSISTLWGVSGGIEPIFALSHNRRSESLGDGEDVVYKVYADIVQEYLDAKGLTSEDELPEYFIESHNINYRDRVKFQGIVQKYVDNAISSTVNLPNSSTVEDIEDLYMLAWKHGLKGITIYRDGCMREGILTIDEKPKDVCPECGGKLIQTNGCSECPECGNSACSL